MHWMGHMTQRSITGALSLAGHTGAMSSLKVNTLVLGPMRPDQAFENLSCITERASAYRKDGAEQGVRCEALGSHTHIPERCPTSPRPRPC